MYIYIYIEREIDRYTYTYIQINTYIYIYIYIQNAYICVEAAFRGRAPGRDASPRPLEPYIISTVVLMLLVVSLVYY